MVRARTALALLVSLTALSPAAAAGIDGSLPEARMTWRLSFGDAGRPLQTGYGLTVGYRGLDEDAPAARLVEIDVSDRAAWVMLAGLPLVERDYRARQNDTPAPETGAQPWYSRRWVMWTVGGIAATAALGGGGGATEEERSTCTGTCNQTGSTSIQGGSVASTNDDGNLCVIDGFGNPEDVCTPDGPGFAERFGRASWAPTDYEWLDAGTGRMGDLIAR